MMDVLLIDNLFVNQTSAGPRTIFYPHLGLLSIAATLNRAGFGTRLLDPKPEFERYLAAGADGDFDLAFIDLILRYRPRLVGFTAYGLNFHHVVTWVRQLRRSDPSIRIMLGGPHVSMLAEDIADFLPEADMLVMGECEGRIVDAVAACLGNRSPEQGIAAVRNGVVLSKEGHQRNLPSCGPPDLGLYLNAPDWNGSSLSFPLEAGRGCPFECTFCSTAAFFGRRYRVRGTQDLIGDIRHLRERWGVTSFDLTHDLFGLRKQFVREFCEQVAPLGIAWQCSMRPDQVTPELAAMLAAAGCSDVYLGFETGSEHLQATIKKRLELMPARRSARLLTRAGINITVSFITGFPDETGSDLRATLDMVGDLLGITEGKVIVQLHLLAPEPGSELGRNAGQLLRYDGIAPDLEPVARADLVKSHPRIFANFRYLDTRLGRRLHVLSSLFVMQVLPAIGYPFAAWIVREIAAGSLAAFFFGIADDIPEPTPDSLGSIRDAMVACCYRRAACHIGRDDLIADYARLRRAVVFMSHCGEPAANGEAGQEAIQDCSLSLTVSHDVVAFTRALEQGADLRRSDWQSGHTLQVRVTRSGGSVSATSTIIG